MNTNKKYFLDPRGTWTAIITTIMIIVSFVVFVESTHDLPLVFLIVPFIFVISCWIYLKKWRKTLAIKTLAYEIENFLAESYPVREFSKLNVDVNIINIQQAVRENFFEAEIIVLLKNRLGEIALNFQDCVNNQNNIKSQFDRRIANPNQIVNVTDIDSLDKKPLENKKRMGNYLEKYNHLYQLMEIAGIPTYDKLESYILFLELHNQGRVVK